MIKAVGMDTIVAGAVIAMTSTAVVTNTLVIHIEHVLKMTDGVSGVLGIRTVTPGLRSGDASHLNLGAQTVWMMMTNMINPAQGAESCYAMPPLPMRMPP